MIASLRYMNSDNWCSLKCLDSAFFILRCVTHSMLSLSPSFTDLLHRWLSIGSCISIRFLVISFVFLNYNFLPQLLTAKRKPHLACLSRIRRAFNLHDSENPLLGNLCTTRRVRPCLPPPAAPTHANHQHNRQKQISLLRKDLPLTQSYSKPFCEMKYQFTNSFFLKNPAACHTDRA